MKIAALYDIHGNLPALNAVLAELETIQPNLIVIGGDIVAGPMPAETLTRLMQLGDRAQFIRGNADREVVAAFDGTSANLDMTDHVREAMAFVAGRITRDQRDFLAGLPERLTLSVDGLGTILFCHATPRNDEEIFTPATPDDRLAVIFANIEQQYVVCGHTHMQFERRLSRLGNLRIINAGSVGMPYADQPGAYWLLLTPEGYEHRRTAYDVDAAAQAIIASGYPGAQEFADENIRTVPTAAEATSVFERMAEEQWARREQV